MSVDRPHVTWTVAGAPEEDVYTGRVTRWIERHGLTGVCELDVAARTMTPYSLARPRE